jgi:hypothetical protein
MSPPSLYIHVDLRDVYINLFLRNSRFNTVVPHMRVGSSLSEGGVTGHAKWSKSGDPISLVRVGPSQIVASEFCEPGERHRWSGGEAHAAMDNQSAIAVAYNPEHLQRVKHMERRHFFVRELVENHQIRVPFVRRPYCG